VEEMATWISSLRIIICTAKAQQHEQLAYVSAII